MGTAPLAREPAWVKFRRMGLGCRPAPKGAGVSFARPWIESIRDLCYVVSPKGFDSKNVGQP